MRMQGQIVGVEMRVKTTFAGLFFVLFSGVSSAQYDAADLNKLFTDKSQRALIDAARSGVAPGGELRQTREVKVSGYVTRSDGKSVVWVNDTNTLESSRLGDVKVNQSNIGKDKKVTISVEGKSKRLKAGETWHKETGKIVDSSR